MEIRNKDLKHQEIQSKAIYCKEKGKRHHLKLKLNKLYLNICKVIEIKSQPLIKRHLGTGTNIKSTLCTILLQSSLAKSQVFGFQSVPFFMTVFLVKQSFECVWKFWFS